MKTSEKYDM